MPEPDAPSAFALGLAKIAKEQHDTFHLIDEDDQPLRGQIRKYWQSLGEPFPGVEVPWSAVFISFCVKKAGASSAEFKFSAAHAVFVNEAIRDAAGGSGGFHGVKITDEQPSVGDIIQNNRLGGKFTFADAKARDDYASHSAIVIARGVDENGKFVITVGGNESDSIRRKRVPLDANGFIRQRQTNPFISLLKNVKA